jgi:hypothetical protein
MVGLRAMRPRKYPLEPLAELRRTRVGEAKGRLAAAVRAREAAADARRGAECRLREEEQAFAEAQRAEGEALGKGLLSAADLARAATWVASAATEHEGLAAGLERAAQGEAAASDAERLARASLASRQSEAEVVEKDSARWQAVRQKKVEGREEEDASEAWRPKR